MTYRDTMEGHAMARPLCSVESGYLYCRNDGRRRHRGKVSGVWHKKQMARARRRKGREEIVAMLEEMAETFLPYGIIRL